MIIWRRGFNLILLLTLTLALSIGCMSAEKKRLKQESVLRVHFEVRPDNNKDRVTEVLIGRETPVKLTVEQLAFLTEFQVEEAKVVDTLGGFMLSVKFERQGAWLLEQYSAVSHGKRFAIYSAFKTNPESKTNLSRWLAAPRISTRIDDGTLVFTPDASREEAEGIALGLNNVARMVKKGIK